jgi:hypothetical protein
MVKVRDVSDNDYRSVLSHLQAVLIGSNVEHQVAKIESQQGTAYCRY